MREGEEGQRGNSWKKREKKGGEEGKGRKRETWAGRRKRQEEEEERRKEGRIWESRGGGAGARRMGRTEEVGEFSKC